MDHDEEFLTQLFREGQVVVRLGRGAAPLSAETAIPRLAEAYEVYRLEIAGPALPFEPTIAFEAAALLQMACRALVSRVDRVDDLTRQIRMSRPPARPGDHLSADLTLRYLSQVHHRARAADPNDPLVAILESVLREWPLSGVLADLDDGPSRALDLGDHPGLCLLYAERLGRRDRPAWRPGGRLARETLELVQQELTRR